MDPIKVDFSNKEAKRSDVVIPPEKAVLKRIIALILTALTAVIAFYFMLPALNFKSYDLYLFIGVVAASYAVFNFILCRAFTKPEYVPYVRKRTIVPGIIILLLALTVGVGYLVSCQFFRAKSYSELIDVRADGNFSEEIEEQDADSFKSIPRLDEDSATQIASRALGKLNDLGYVSQFTVYSENYQINYKETPVRVAPLQYANIIKWFFNTRNGFPGYVIIDMANESAEFKDLGTNGNGEMKTIKYSPAEHFNKLLKRHLRFLYPTYMFADATFEIDDEGNPYWICARLDKTIGLFGGTDVIGAVVVKADSEDGECTYYTVDEFRTNPDLEWIDRIYDNDLIVEQFDYYGKYRDGFWISILSQKNVISTTVGNNYIAKDDDVWMYTGVTSVTADQSITGFVLVNQRTKEATLYNVTGGTESSAQQTAQDRVQDLGYTATFPLLLNIGGEPTYFLSLKGDNSIVQQYALINVERYNNNKMVVNGTDLNACLKSYVEALRSSGVDVAIDVNEIGDDAGNNSGNDGGDIEAEPINTAADIALTGNTASGTVTDIRSAVKGGETYYYIKLSIGSAYYTVSASQDERAVLLNVGDSVTVTFEGEGEIKQITALN